MRKNVRYVCLLALSVAGCASTVQKSDEGAPLAAAGAPSGKAIVLNMTGSKDSTTAKDWTDFKGLWRDACAREATAVSAAFLMQEGEAQSTGAAGTLVVVDVIDYRYISTGARIAFGVMTGNAYINAKVTFRDLASGAVRTTKSYDTTSTAWQGIFSGMTAKQVQAMCHEIVGEIAR